jgi:hypothetical protein
MTNASVLLFSVVPDYSIDCYTIFFKNTQDLTLILPEVVFMALITYILTALALELGQGRSKKELAL